MGRPITQNSTDVSTRVLLTSVSTGLGIETIDENTTSLLFWYHRQGEALVTNAAAALASLTTAHTDWGIEHVKEGYYRLDPPDAAFVSGADDVEVGVTDGQSTFKCTAIIHEIVSTSSAGVGANEVELTIQDTTGTAVADCEVWVTTGTDPNANVAAGTLETDANGLVTFMLDAGTYNRWAQKTGTNFTNPQEFTVT